MGYLGIMLIMRYHDDGGALVVQLGKQMHHLGSILGIKITRRLIGKDELRTEDHGTGDGYSLLLTTRKLVREVLGTMLMAIRFIIACTFALRSAFGMLR